MEPPDDNATRSVRCIQHATITYEELQLTGSVMSYVTRRTNLPLLVLQTVLDNANDAVLIVRQYKCPF